MHFSISIDEFQAVDLPESYRLLSQYFAIKKVTDPILSPSRRLRKGRAFVPAW